MARNVRGFGGRGLAVATVTLTLLAGCGGGGGRLEPVDPVAAVPVTSPTPTLSPTPSPTLSPTPSAVPSGGASPARSTPKRIPTPTKKPNIALPPPPNSPQVPPPTNAPSGASCPSYAGPKAPMSDVKAALTKAAGTPYWRGASKPEGYSGDGSEITVPLALMKAIAWQESGWQSTIVACDGGIGTMQVMPGTASWMNQRFGTSHDVHTLAGNTALGAEYLQWLIMYFGLYYFGTFDLNATASVGAGDAQMRLRDVVIAAYNVGPGALENADGTLSIPNQRYVNNVVALMSTCECLAY
jgi:hypothetical protein